MIAAQSERRVNIVQGEYYVTSDPNLVILTLLGSCVAACMRDPVAGVGGLNHYLLPAREDAGDSGLRDSVHLMELLVNGLLKAGARKERIEVKIFGGARTLKGLSDIGRQNISFAENFIGDEGLKFVGGSTGGEQGRRIQYWPVSGRARQIFLAGESAFQQKPVKREFQPAVRSGDVELF
ncbi:MAG: chemotaxis protein CheD [Hyphomicrobium sp.]